jgi:hypothetical protein
MRCGHVFPESFESLSEQSGGLGSHGLLVALEIRQDIQTILDTRNSGIQHRRAGRVLAEDALDLLGRRRLDLPNTREIGPVVGRPWHRSRQVWLPVLEARNRWIRMVQPLRSG